MRTAACFVGVVAFSWAQAANAGEEPPAPAASLPSIAPAPSSESWWTRYRAARALMAEGNWEGAVDALDALAKEAPDSSAAARVTDDAALCRTWIQRGLVLVARADLGESTLHARQANQRTIDELAVLYTNAVFYGLGTGAWLASRTEPDSAAGAILPALGFAGASALGVYALDQGKPLGYGVPQSMVTGMYIGLYEGIAWTVWNQSRYRYNEAWEGKTVATVIWGSASLGLAVGGILGTQRKTTPGRASFVGSAALWSSVVLGFVTAGVAPNDDKLDDRSWLAAALGVNAGALAGALGAGSVSPTIARVRFLDLGGIAGLVLSGGLFLASESRNEQAGLLAMGLGSSAGLAAAWIATTGMPKDDPKTDAPSATGFGAARLVAAPVRGGATLGIGGEF